MKNSLCALLIAVSLIPCLASAQVPIESGMVHLRIDGPREWSTFPESPDSQSLERSFSAQRNDRPVYVQLRHQDVKQTWQVELNGKPIGKLKIDENDMVEYFTVPVGGVMDGRNQFRIYQDTKRRPAVDDIRVGEIVLGESTADSVLSGCQVQIRVIDADSGKRLPARITITNSSGALQTVGAQTNDHLAVRPGIVYTSTGTAEFGLPAGEFTISAGRGFEYSLASTTIDAAVGKRISQTLTIRREVPTHGYVACDTHVHTLTHSGHGDATVGERMITLAAEGIELPIATDHNVQIDHRPFAIETGVAEFFTPVIGNEVTTTIGHFNIWPTTKDAPVPDHKLQDWSSIADAIFRTPQTRIAILNHPRDLHGGTKPFGPKLHNSVTGTNLDGWPIRFNGMEVINSGATQTDIMQLFHDWMGLLNAGYRITPVGCSDSHDVGRHFVGQGRTYIRCDDQDAGHIDVDRATTAFVNGEVMVSYGLLCEMTVDGKYRSGTFAQPSGDKVNVDIRVLGPHWTRVSEVLLFANGQQIRSKSLTDSEHSDGRKQHAGIHANVAWSLDLPSHDVHLVAIALGPGIDGLHWKTAKAYQPASPDWTARTISCSGAIWIDADRDGRQTPAVEYARRIVTSSEFDVQKTVALLTEYDQATAAHTAQLLRSHRVSLVSDDMRAALSRAPSAIRRGFEIYQSQWRANQIARSER